MIEDFKENNTCTRTVNEYLNKFLNFLQVEKKYSANTLEAYYRDLVFFLNFFSNLRQVKVDVDTLESLSLFDLRKWLSTRGLDHTNSSNARAVAVLRSFFKFLKRNNLIINQEIDKLKTPKISKSLPRPVAIVDIKKIIDEIAVIRKKDWHVKRDQALIYLIYGCGLRISEALSIRLVDIQNFQNIVVMGKGKKQRIIPLLEPVTDALKKYFQICPYKFNTDLNNPLRLKGIFIKDNCQAMTRFDYNQLITLIRRKLNLSEDITPHSFRHSFATHLLQNGSDLRVIQDLLGHESLSTTQKYTKIDRVKIIEAFQKFANR
ncbi:tyrosine recombinase XerC [Alphaproteobacteria bacterium]|nr:tyrosine recombinase XerC [Alphaproteobacteria bacterium]